MRTILFYIMLIALAVSCTKDDEPYYSDCGCENVRGYLIEVCEGQGNWERASDNALALQAKGSNCGGL